MRDLIALLTFVACCSSADAGWRHRRAPVVQQPCARSAPAVTSASVAVGASNTTIDPSGFLAEINRVRAQHGLASLGWSDRRADYSQRHADVVARSRGAFHPGRYPIGLGEIMARGQQSIQEACGDWLNSPGHRALLLGNFRVCGAARSGDVWFVQFE